MRNERNAWQGILSVVALFALAFSFTAEFLWSGASIGSPSWSMLNILTCSLQWTMPIFVSLFGSVFLSSAHPIKIKLLWRDYVLPASISCIIWWALSAIVWMQNNHPQDLDLLTFRECLAEVLKAPSNIGFCHMLVSFFILYPLLHKIAQNRKLTEYAICLIFVMSLLEPWLRNIRYLSALALFADQLNWGYYRAWSFYLLCGAFFTKHDLDWIVCLLLYSFGIISTGAMAALTSLGTNFAPGYENAYIGFASPLTGIQTIALLLFFRRSFAKVHLPRFTRWTANLWYCIPVLPIVSAFTERLMTYIEVSDGVNAIISASLNALLTIGVIVTLGCLPGLKTLVGDYSHCRRELI